MIISRRFAVFLEGEHNSATLSRRVFNDGKNRTIVEIDGRRISKIEPRMRIVEVYDDGYVIVVYYTLRQWSTKADLVVKEKLNGVPHWTSRNN